MAIFEGALLGVRALTLRAVGTLRGVARPLPTVLTTLITINHDYHDNDGDDDDYHGDDEIGNASYLFSRSLVTHT